MTADRTPPEAVKDQINRIVASESFRQAESLRRLLSYLAEKSLSGEAAQLKEYTVGVDVFGKPPDYDPQKDASVRIQAGKLRQKLAQYYSREGAADPVLVEFPKGRFELRFTANRPAEKPPARVLSWKLAGAVMIAVLLGSFAAWLVGRSTRLPALTREQRAIWSPLIEPDRTVIVCIGTPLFVKTPQGFFRSPSINRWDEAGQAGYPEWLRAEITAERAQPVYIYTGVGDSLGAVEIARLLTRAGAKFVARRCSALSWEELANNHVVFLGPPKYTARLNEIPARPDLIMEGRSIRNLRPRPGEPELLEGNWPEGAPHVLEDYALISRLPGIHGRTRYLMLSASSTEGTAAAALFVTDPKFAAELVRRVAGASGRLPEFFQVVIHARFREMVPVEITYQFHHELKESPPPGGLPQSP